MKNLKPIVFLCWLTALTASTAHGATVISNFSSLNPLSFAYGGSTWASPNQFQLFTDSGVSGQEVLSIGGGNPTVSGGAGVLGLSLNLAGTTALQLTARFLSGNQATTIQALLFDADGTILRFNFPAVNFNTSTFASALATVAGATTVAAGSTPGFDFSNVTVYEMQGNFFDGGGTAAFRAQFDDLTALTAVPEPATLLLLGVGITSALVVRRCKRGGVSTLWN